ncbi:hypothetical protein ACP4OV_026443 [Aristida adscensionis]
MLGVAPGRAPRRNLRSPVHRCGPPPHPPGVRALARLHLSPARLPPPVDRRRPPPAPDRQLPSRHLLRVAPRRRPARRRRFPSPAGRRPVVLRHARGWLALSDHETSPTRLLLWDPSSGAEIVLPALPSVCQVFLSEDPLTSPHWMALASKREGSFGQRMFSWRPGEDSWSLMTTTLGDRNISPRLNSVAFHGGKAFFIDLQSILLVYDLNLGTTSAPTFVRRSYLIPAVTPRRCPSCRFHSVLATHVAACNGELLLVVLHGWEHPAFAEIYKPGDWTAGRLELGDKVKDLGGYSLFLGRGDALALRADDFPWIRRNCVYFAPHDQAAPPQRDWLVVFDLESGALQRYPGPQKHKEDGSRWQPYFWLCVNSPFLNK